MAISIFNVKIRIYEQEIYRMRVDNFLIHYNYYVHDCYDVLSQENSYLISWMIFKNIIEKVLKIYVYICKIVPKKILHEHLFDLSYVLGC